MALLIAPFNKSKVEQISYLYQAMEAIHQAAIRHSYTRLSQSIQAELDFLDKLAELTDDERFRQSLAEVVYSLSDVSNTLDVQRRYLRPRNDTE